MHTYMMNCSQSENPNDKIASLLNSPIYYEDSCNIIQLTKPPIYEIELVYELPTPAAKS